MSDPTRFDLIRPTLERYRRRFSVLDLGCGTSDVSRRIAREFDAVVTVIDKDLTTTYPLDYEGLPRWMALRREFSAADLERLGECEFFDVVLAFNILHWFGDDAVRALNAVQWLGAEVFVQVPYVDDRDATGQETLRPLHKGLASYTVLGETAQFPCHRPRPLYRIPGLSGMLSRSTWTSHGGSAAIWVRPAWDACICEVHGCDREWIHGINLWNFANLGGCWPRRDRIRELLAAYPLPPDNHGDVTPWNFILDGSALHLIDGFEDWGFDDRENLKRAIETVEERLT